MVAYSVPFPGLTRPDYPHRVPMLSPKSGRRERILNFTLGASEEEVRDHCSGSRGCRAPCRLRGLWVTPYRQFCFRSLFEARHSDGDFLEVEPKQRLGYLSLAGGEICQENLWSVEGSRKLLHTPLYASHAG